LVFQINLIPVKYIGGGEGIEDLQVFNKHEFVDSFLNRRMKRLVHIFTL
jgi:signal recognition particle GTPase